MTEPTWVPEACTLPSRERPLRVAEFDALFATALHAWERPAATLLRLSLEPGCDAELRDLTARETACCSFFTFTVRRAGTDLLTLDISVPGAQAPILDALSASLPCGTGTQRNSPPAPNASAHVDASPADVPASAYGAAHQGARRERPGSAEDRGVLPEPLPVQFRSEGDDGTGV